MKKPSPKKYEEKFSLYPMKIEKALGILVRKSKASTKVKARCGKTGDKSAK